MMTTDEDVAQLSKLKIDYWSSKLFLEEIGCYLKLVQELKYHSKTLV